MIKTKLLVAGAAIVSLGLGATTAQAATDTAQAEARILSPVAVTKVLDLNFGTIVPGATADVVTLDFASAVTCGSLTCVGTPQTAEFTVEGTAGEQVTVDAIGTITLTRSGGGASMTADLAPNVPYGATAWALPAASNTVLVGGDLNVGANQQAGVYIGSFDLTVNYN